MSRVAIIGMPNNPLYTQPLTSRSGAGPSGLVTAKTLLQQFPTFSPLIFDTQSRVGGLWNVAPETDQPVKLDPRMPTNLSRFTVAFSDLDWDSVVDDVPVFPRASQVCRYLNCYADRYIPKEVLRLGCKVVATTRKVDNERVKWNVKWLQDRYALSTQCIVWNTHTDLPKWFAESKALLGGI